MSSSVKVSIGMPVFNGAAFIESAIESLRAQSFTNFELIISDNCSSDQTREICTKYQSADARICYFRQSENIGAAGNFEFVLERACGEFFMWAAHDDLWDQSHLAAALAVLENDGLDFAFPSFWLESTQFGIRKRVDPQMFDFLDHRDRRVRVLRFLALHHMSHKCNLVYSLFRADLIRAALRVQSIDDDAVLSAVVLGLSRGRALDQSSFHKRYQFFWPGLFNFRRFFSFYFRDRRPFTTYKSQAVLKLCALFPEYSVDIEEIFSKYGEWRYGRKYKICDSIF